MRPSASTSSVSRFAFRVSGFGLGLRVEVLGFYPERKRERERERERERLLRNSASEIGLAFLLVQARRIVLCVPLVSRVGCTV